MKAYKNQTLTEYTRALSRREPVPGGGSVAALNGALGCALIGMAAEYAVGKMGTAVQERKLQTVIKQVGVLREQFLALVDADAQAFLDFTKVPRTDVRKKARAAVALCKVPHSVCRLALKALDLTPFLVVYGNSRLIGDVEIAVEQLWTAWRSAFILTQPEGKT